MDRTLTKVPRQNLIIGYRQVVRGIASNHLGCVVIASDIDIGIKNKIVSLCQDKKVQYRIGNTKAEMGKLLNLDVACAVYAENDITE